MIVRTYATSGGLIRVEVTGEIDLSTIDDFASALTGAVAVPGISGVVVDFAGVSFCDSSGIRALDRAYHEASLRDVAFRLTNPQRGVRRLLEFVGVLDHLAGRR